MTDQPARFPWLRWQPIRFSPWLKVSLLVTGLLYVLVPVFLEWQRDGGSFSRAYQTWGQQVTTQPPSLFSILYSLIATGVLVWFTYFSRSPRVKDHDRFAVLLMLCGASVGWVVTIIRFLAKL
jgi:hypothetical protein